MASAILVVAACDGPASDDARSSVGQCEVGDHADVCAAPPQAITASSTEANAPVVDAGVTYAIASSNKHNYVVFTATESGTHTLYYGDSEPVRVCHEDALCASHVDDCGALERVAQYAFVAGEPNVIEVKKSDHPFQLHIVGPEIAPPPPPPSGGAKLAAPVFYGTMNRYAGQLGVADFNGDGAIDVVVANGGLGAVESLDILHNNGSGAFIQVTHVAAPNPFEYVIADFDGGGPDIAMIGYGGSGPLARAYFHNTGDFAFTTTYQWSTTNDFSYRSLQGGDFNEDGVVDLVASYDDGPDDPEGGFFIHAMPGFAVLQQQDHFIGRTGSSLAGDFNGDGHQDVILADRADPVGGGPIVALFVGDGSGSVSFDRNITLASSQGIGGLGHFVALDLDGNAYTDFLAYPGGVSNGASLTLSSPAGFATQLLPGVLGGGAAADWDGDGRTDLIVTTIAPGSTTKTQLVLYRGTSSGFVNSGAIPGSTMVGGGFLIVADVNKDGRPDLIANTLLDGQPGATAAAIAVYLGTP